MLPYEISNMVLYYSLNLVWVNQKTPSDIVRMMYVDAQNILSIFSNMILLRLTASLLGRYWYLTNTTVNGSEYRYFAYGMHSKMDTPPKYSYVCPTATFTQYDSTGKYGAYNTSNKFSIKHFQVSPLLSLLQKRSNFSCLVSTILYQCISIRSS